MSSNLNTGLPEVEDFLADIPRLLFNPTLELEPITFFYLAEGKGHFEVLKVIDGQPDRDDHMDAVASGTIAFIKTYRPAAVIMVSETFVQTVEIGKEDQRLPPVDCSRFTADPAYRAQILLTRSELLAAIVETERGSFGISWPIIREGGTRRLGPPGERASATGRFCDLMRKQHAADVIFETCADHGHRPEPLRLLQERYPAAMTGVASAENIDTHTFDFQDGIRLIVCRAGEESLCVIGINHGDRVALTEFRKKILVAFSLLSGHDFIEADILTTAKYPKLGSLALQLAARDLVRGGQ